MKTANSKLILVFVSFVLFLGSIAGYVYMYRAVYAAHARAILVHSVVESQKNDGNEEKNVAAMYERTKGDRERLSTFLVKDTAAVSFIETLENIGSQVGSTVALSSVVGDDNSNIAVGGFSKISAHIDATGPWSSVLRTLMLSEVLPFQTRIDGVTLSSVTVNENKVLKSVWKASYNISATVLVTSATGKIK